MNDAVKSNPEATAITPEYELGEDSMSLEQFLLHLFKTQGIDFGHGDCASINEAVGQASYAHMEAVDRSIEAAMPGVVVALVKERNPNSSKQFGDEKLLALAKVLYDLCPYPPPYLKVEVMLAALARLSSHC